MIYTEKSPKPSFTVNYKDKTQTRPLIRADFFDVCYLCERHVEIDYEIDHFLPQNDYPTKENDWDNLYFICGKCNKIKSNSYNKPTGKQILDCCKKNEADAIELSFDATNKAISIQSNSSDTALNEKIANTIELLEKIYHGKKKSSLYFVDLKNEILKRIAVFEEVIEEYKTNKILKKITEKKVIQHINVKKIKEKYNNLQSNSQPYKLGDEPCFISFKRSIIKNDHHLSNEFAGYFD